MRTAVQQRGGTGPTAWVRDGDVSPELSVALEPTGSATTSNWGISPRIRDLPDANHSEYHSVA